MGKGRGVGAAVEVGAGDEVGSVLVSTGMEVTVAGGTVSVVGGTSVGTE